MNTGRRSAHQRSRSMPRRRSPEVISRLFPPALRLEQFMASRSVPTLPRLPSQWNHLRLRTQAIEVISPSLHQYAALRKPLRLVIRRPDPVALRVRQLQLDDIRGKPLLIEERTRHTAKPMTGLLVARVAQPPQCRIYGVIRHRAIASKKRRKYVTPGVEEALQRR